MTLCSLLSAFLTCTTAPFASGYVEGDYVLVAPIESARIEVLPVPRGAHLAPGAPLVTMEKRAAEIALASAEAALEKARAQLADLTEGKRPEEIAVIKATLASARAQASEAERTADRLTRLAASGSATATQSDDAATALEVARARVAEAEASLAVASLPARPQAIAAAQAAVTGAQAERDRAAWALDQRQLTAPSAGTVTDILRRPGEIAGPSAPVLSFLPDGAVKLRLYVPEGSVAALKVGASLQVHCDGCAAGLTAQVTYISDAPEFTPPVIYSLENRQKLVYLVEAKPSAALNPGQIVDVDLE